MHLPSEKQAFKRYKWEEEKNRDGKHTEQSLKVQGTRYEVKEEEKNFKKPLMFLKNEENTTFEQILAFEQKKLWFWTKNTLLLNKENYKFGKLT